MTRTISTRRTLFTVMLGAVLLIAGAFNPIDASAKDNHGSRSHRKMRRHSRGHHKFSRRHDRRHDRRHRRHHSDHN